MSAPAAVAWSGPVCASSLAAAARVKELRKARGWNQDNLAREAGLSRCMMSFLEAGRRNFTLPMLERIAGALGTDPAELLKVRYHLTDAGYDDGAATVIMDALNSPGACTAGGGR